MDVLRVIENWLKGGHPPYQSLVEAMHHDIVWAVMLVGLVVIVLAGYGTMAWRWRQQERQLAGTWEVQALRRMRRSLQLGVGVGFASLPLAMVWPAWRLYVLLLVGVAMWVWYSACKGRDIKLLCRAVARPRGQKGELANAKAESQRKTYFLNTLSHDLKNPLHGVTLQIQVAEASLDIGDTASVRRSLYLMRECTQEATSLLDTFLELGRLDWSDDPLDLSEFDGTAVIQTVVESSRPLAEYKQLHLSCEMPTALPLYCDRRKLERICHNLLNNALKYTNAGKVIIKGVVRGRSLILEVEDTGPGIPEEHQEHLFDAFYRAHHEATHNPTGYGLGLAIVDRLVQRLGGHIELDSVPGRGTRFCIHIPNACAGTTSPPSEAKGSDYTPTTG